MEKRFILAIALSFLVIFLWQSLFMKKPEPLETPPRETMETMESQKIPAVSETVPAEAPEEQEIPVSSPVGETFEEDIVIETSLYRSVWSNRGAVLKSWKLKEHKDENSEDLELVSRNSNKFGLYPFQINTDDPDFDSKANQALFSFSVDKKQLSDGEETVLRFQYADGKGSAVEKTFSFRGGQYQMGVDISASKNGMDLEPRMVWGAGFGNPSPEEQKKGRIGNVQGVAVYSGQDTMRRDENKFDPEKGNAFNFVRWAAYENNYFAAMFLASPQKSSAVFSREERDGEAVFSLAVNHVGQAYIGPKQFDLLRAWGYNAHKIVKFGLFGWFSEILYKGIKSIHKAFPNWGLSIIILTILIKIILFPLTYSSTKSMAKMQELQPKIKALRAKYKKAKQDIVLRRKMNEEMMALYKQHGINPAGGCLPILLQLPIFWGFFRLLVVAVEFRHSPFALWINDLSVKDPYYVTPILMGITQFISQKMTPTSADPSQQKMMLIMPVIMTVFFMNFMSGLVLYWLTNNILQIGQQYIMNRLIHKKKRELHGKSRKK